MIGYLTAVEGRDLSSIRRGSLPESGPGTTAGTTPIMPRLPSEYEAWGIAASDQLAAERGLREEAEQSVVSPTFDPPIRARTQRRLEVNPSTESHVLQFGPTTSSTRVVDSELKPVSESSSAETEPARRDTEAEPLRQRTVAARSERRHEDSVSHATSKTITQLAKAEVVTTSRSEERLVRAVVAPAPVILPQIRGGVSVISSPANGESHARQRGENSPAATSEPSIVVTIGRIEIRAVTSPSQSRPRPERPALMSLDDYLKQRVRGVR